MKISDVLFEAANERLWNGKGDWLCSDGAFYSCDAVTGVYYMSQYGHSGPEAIRFLAELGCNTNSTQRFDEFKVGAERQGARYLWLMFAYLVALDEEL